MKTLSQKLLIILGLVILWLGLFLLSACQQKTTPDTKAGKSAAQTKTNFQKDPSNKLADGQPGVNTYVTEGPGETKVLPRPYATAPPLIPHSIQGLEITRDSNPCLGCHEKGLALSEGHTATQPPKTHLSNAYTKKGVKEGVTGIRYNCLQCHVIQAKEALPKAVSKP